MPNSRAARGVTWSWVRAPLGLVVGDAGKSFCGESSGSKASDFAASEGLGTNWPL